MCGELDEEDRLESDLCHRFLVQAGALLRRRPAAGGDAPDPSGLNGYLDGLFAEVLHRVMHDVEQADPKAAYERLAMQSVVLARLAGFIAGHANLAEDPLRKLLEASMLGYAEADMPRPAHDHDHDHGHDDHAHGHGHHHHH